MTNTLLSNNKEEAIKEVEQFIKGDADEMGNK